MIVIKQKTASMWSKIVEDIDSKPTTAVSVNTVNLEKIFGALQFAVISEIDRRNRYSQVIMKQVSKITSEVEKASGIDRTSALIKAIEQLKAIQ